MASLPLLAWENGSLKRNAFCLLVAILAGLMGSMGVVRAQSGVLTTVEGHVLHATNHTKLPGVLVVAHPCGIPTSTDASGSFRVSCPHGIDSIVVSCIGYASQVVAAADDHVDVWLEELQVNLDKALVTADRTLEQEREQLRSGDLMAVLDATPGLQSLDLGGGMIQPVIRGLFGSRVAVLENGVPQQGGRWGSDHGILVAPQLQVANAWVAGGGHAWLGPDAVGGGLRFESPSLLNTKGVSTRFGTTARVGNPKGQLYVLHADSRGDRHWHLGLSASQFGANQVPQRTFTYIGRTYQLETGDLPNTGGRAIHAVAGLGRRLRSGWLVSWTARASDVNQGLFPGIIGIPMQGDLAPNANPFDVRLPNQHASRVQTVLEGRKQNNETGELWAVKAAASWNRRLEHAPPHAHGWGPVPESDLSLFLTEWTSFTEARRMGAHRSFGFQSETQSVQTDGWEFLIPNHQRFRMSAIGEQALRGSTLSVRLDAVHSVQEAYDEPLYNSLGEVVGVDVRAEAFKRTVPGGMVTWQRPFRSDERNLRGTTTITLHGRVPSNQEWGANGIHHGTFRFEQGDPDLNTEWTLEGRGKLSKGAVDEEWTWAADGFIALHRGFISLTPSARFAPISHAGLIYRFEANDAFRTGMEASITRDLKNQTWKAEGAVIGQWDLLTGLGLPFTPPPQLNLSWEGRNTKGTALTLSTRAVAPAILTARNEPSTDGAFLADCVLRQTSRIGQWTLKVHNVFNAAWLDHISAYRALGLVAQGRWVELNFSATLKHHTKN